MLVVYIHHVSSGIKYFWTIDEDSWLLHRRIAYIHMHYLNKFLSKDLLNGLPKLKFEKDKVCEAWQKGKQTKVSIKQRIFFAFRPP